MQKLFSVFHRCAAVSPASAVVCATGVGVLLSQRATEVTWERSVKALLKPADVRRPAKENNLVSVATEQIVL